ncbi:TELO2-interacting protein 2-like [Sinocyclocheilus anshuiensis]|uniref:TELO2-interacting protein 2-like n=1 Tax=Sinocyclocheilus anshuiensis TaxID=1608454 RepID=A0A671M6V2_9TELE|nr:PREDICTED: TELO2-interacting protein 2-like [Sinocyclocheilus anshuiensis]XP_016345686.1 PREDICTED: TELO2-interacting protein 2-like [Sinocyclocheilus anshuiensis]
MDVAHILQEMKIRDAADSCCSAFSRIQERLELEEAPEGRAFILGETAELLSLAPLDWLFPEANADLRGQYLGLVNSFTRYAALPLCDTDSGTLPAKSYEDIPAKAQAVSAVLLALSAQIQNALEHQNRPDIKSLVRTLAPSFCIFSVTHLLEQPWSSAASRNRARELLASAVALMGSRSLQELLSGKPGEGQKGLLGPVLDTLQLELTKESWKRNQAVKHVFSWMLVQVERPCLTEYLEKVFPPSLLISDDYRTENKVLGVHCLHHIVLNVPAADLRQFNRAQVLYHALFNHLHTSEAVLIQVVLPCLLDLLSVLEKPPVHSGLPRKPNRFDDVLRHILTYMEMEHKLDLRRVYAKNLVLFIERMGIVIIRHLKRLERVIVGYLEVSDAPEEEARLSILDALQKTLQIAWPRMERRMGSLAQSLLRFLVDVSSESIPTHLKEQLMTQASHCLLLLDHCSKGKLQTLLRELDSSCVPEPVLKCIQKVTAASVCQ